MPKKMVRAATRMAILSKFQDQEAIIVDDLSITEVKTKQIATLLKALKLTDKTCLLGIPNYDDKLYLSARTFTAWK